MKSGCMFLLVVNLIGATAHAQYGNPSGDKSYVAEFANPNTGRSEYRVIDKTNGNQGNTLYRSNDLRSAHQYREIREGRASGDEPSQQRRSMRRRRHDAESNAKSARHPTRRADGELVLTSTGKIQLTWKGEKSRPAQTLKISCDQNNWYNKPFITLGKIRYQFQETCNGIYRVLKADKSGKTFIRMNSNTQEVELLKRH